MREERNHQQWIRLAEMSYEQMEEVRRKQREYQQYRERKKAPKAVALTSVWTRSTIMDLKFATSSRNNSVWTRSTIMDPLPDVVCSRGYDQSMTYIPTFRNIIAKRFKLTIGKINYKWNDNIYYWKREYPRCVTKLLEFKYWQSLILCFIFVITKIVI